MLVMPLFFLRLGVKWMLFVGMLAWVARYFLFAMGAGDGVIWMLLSGIILHGICYDFFFVTGQIYTDKVASPQIRSQAQGLLVLFTLGIGMLIGAQVAGKVEKAYTPANSGELVEQAGEVDKKIVTLRKEQESAQATRKTEIDGEISSLRDKRKDLLLRSADWKTIWLIPAVGALVIMVLFALMFKEDTNSTDEKKPPEEAVEDSET